MATPEITFRRAIQSDLVRLALVSAAGFSASPVFESLFPNRSNTQAIVDHYRSGCLADLGDTFVAEADYRENESDDVFDELKSVYLGIEKQVPDFPSKNNKVIVGIVVLSEVKLSPLPSQEPTKPQDEKKYPLPQAVKNLIQPQNAAKERFIDKGYKEIVSLAVHPAYRNRGVGQLMIEELQKIAGEERQKLVIFAAPDGKRLTKRLGFVDGGEVTIARYAEYPLEIPLWIGIWDWGKTSM